jgi:hypothetical protein
MKTSLTPNRVPSQLLGHLQWRLLNWKVIVAVLLATVILGATQITPPAVAKVFSDDPSGEGRKKGSEDHRMREGTQVEKISGHFKLTGDRVTFVTADGKQRFGGLENLALERVARVVKDSPGQLRWSIAGVITEYRGANYLLVTHAVLADETKDDSRP